MLHELKESSFMAVAADSSNSLHIEECDFNEPVLNKIVYMNLFSCINYPLTAKYTTGELIAKQIIFKF